MLVYYYDAATHRLHAITLQHADALHAHCFRKLTRDMLIVHADDARVPTTARAASISMHKIQTLYDAMCARQCAECIDDLARILAVGLSKGATPPDPPLVDLESPD